MREIRNEQDLRVIRTRKSLRDAYIRLAGKYRRSQITVTNLTKEAMINRKTFYGHYESIDDLLDDVERDVTEKTVKEVLIIRGGRALIWPLH